MHEFFLNNFDSFLTALDTWGTTDHVTWTVAAAAFTATVKPTITALKLGIAVGSYTSASVKVED